MAKSYGEIGFSKSVEVRPGVWENEIIRKNYAYDIVQDTRRWNNDGNLNDNVTLTVRISILADDFATQNLPAVKYVTWHGCKFAVSSIEVAYPRFVMTLGGVYNGE